MSIQKATILELESLTELFDLYRVFYEQTSDPDRAREFLRERLTNGESVVFMAFEEGNPVGFVQLYPSFSSVSMVRSWVLNDLYVKESARKKGFGEELLKGAITFARETGAKGVLLETGKDNVNAQKLYEKIGFVRESNYFYHFTI
ncbi:GNAT family N-acetyltransferase [Peribacillus sp. SIMBA_075]|jgi:ribosomal protein S18 acetylase RimI-like enzyme|uniref:GNAT family N-acetyltransferase n=1 Tax=Peribacillus TaxID=2675229 RepID=UPI000B666299|nr:MULTISPECIES: GNAT family N-acetyltransferase [Peribacillus]MDV7767128.1 GNAT family N-acetyltransferase [Peribacillus sp. CSMR9]MDW7615928.1 GNAT family N-acetyltransferase [Peribacillus simplex]SNT54384.1 Acetyltransferase (GNAT) family protein [Bacillus sp. OK838]